MHLGHGELGREQRCGCAARSHDAGGWDLELTIADLVDKACGDRAGNGDGDRDRDGG